MTKKRICILLVWVMMFSLLIPTGVFAANLPSPTKQPFQNGEVIFQTWGNGSDDLNILKKYGLKMVRRNERLGYVLASVSPGTNPDQLAARMSKDKAISFAQPNYNYQLFGQTNDPYFGRQWALSKINAEKGWQEAEDSSDITIAILDTGIDVNHPDLKGRLVGGINTLNPLKSARDNDGHGTHVAGITAAVTNNVLGVAGISKAKIMPVKVFDDWGGTDLSISDGIVWAVDHGADVINMSFGSFYQSDVLNEAIEYAYDQGVVMIAAAGNWASEEISYPAAVSKVISVSAVDRQDKLAKFSSYGPEIDISAPGEGIYSTIWDPYKGSTYSEMSGTSMASPMVAGLAALLLAKYPGITNDEVRQLIEVSAVDLGDPGWDPEFGHGRIDIYRALTLELEKIDDGNGTQENAVLINDGVPVKEKINYGSDEDWYQIQVPDDGHLEVEVLPAGKVSPGVVIYGADGEVMAAFNTTPVEDTPIDLGGQFVPASRSVLKVAEVVHGLSMNLAGGNYFIKVFGNHFRWSEEDYTLTARVLGVNSIVNDRFEPNNTYEEAAGINVGQPIQGAILGSDDEDWYKVELPGQAYKIKLEVPGALDLGIVVESEAYFQDPETDEEIAEWVDQLFYEEINNVRQGKDEEGILILPENGGMTYFIKVSEAGGLAANAQYTLIITEYEFKPDAFESNDTWQEAAPIAIGDTITAGFHEAEDEDWYAFEVFAEGVVLVDLSESNSYSWDIEFYTDPEGSPLDYGYYSFEDDYYFGSGSSTTDLKVLPGKYYLRIINWSSSASDDYTMNLQFHEFSFIDQEINDIASLAEEIVLFQTKEGTLYPAGDTDVYYFDVEEPQPFLVYLIPNGELDTQAIVMKQMEIKSNEGGELDAESDGPDEPILEPVTGITGGEKGQADTGVFSPSKPGRYYIGVSAVEGRSTASYSLSIRPFSVTSDQWEPNNLFSEAVLLKNGVMVQPTFMGIEDTDWYKIYIPGNGTLGVTLTVPNDIDGVFEVFDSAGKFLGKVDDAMQGIDESATFQAAGPGYYFVKAIDYLGNSSVLPYSLTLKYVDTEAPKVSSIKVGGKNVSFSISEDAKVFIKVLNSKDQFVDMIIDGTRYRKGVVSGIWDGIDASGKKVSPGTFKLKIVIIDGAGNKSKPIYQSMKI